MKKRNVDLLPYSKDLIKREYLKYKTITAVIKTTGFGYKTIRKVLIEAGLMVEKGVKHKKDFTMPEIDSIYIDYNDRGFSIASLRDKHKTTENVIRGILSLDAEKAPRYMQFSSTADVLIYCARSATRSHKTIMKLFKPTKANNPNKRFTWYAIRTTI